MKKFLAFLGCLLLVIGVALILLNNNGKLLNQIGTNFSNMFSSLTGDKTGSESAKATEPQTEANKYNSLNKDGGNNTDYYTPVDITYGYDSLQTQGQKDLYNKIDAVVYSESSQQGDNGKYSLERFTLENVEISEGEIRVIMEAYGTDHPKIFWLSNVFAYYSDSSGTTVELYSEYSPDEIDKCRKELDTAIENILSEVPKRLSEFDRELYIHDVIADKCVYDKTTKVYEDDKAAFSMYGTLVNGKAVCEGYAKTTEYLLSCLGVQCITVNGVTGSELHKWNLVNLDGDWYNLDVTWDDNEDFVVYTYFNLTDSQISYNHSISEDYTEMTEEQLCNTGDNTSNYFNLAPPSCTATYYNFYNIKGNTFNGFDDNTSSTMETALRNAIANKDKYFFIRVNSTLDFDSSVQQMFYEDPYQFFVWVRAIDEEGALTSSVSIIKNKELGYIQVTLEYNT